jgi:ABC-type Zn2+ transport system substrate-binding protein/surface adhesin
LPHGRYELVVIANGIESEPMEVHVGEEEREHHGHEHEHKENHNGWEKKHEYVHEEEGNLKLELRLPLSGVKN